MQALSVEAGFLDPFQGMVKVGCKDSACACTCQLLLFANVNQAHAAVFVV
jgi:hypothetical protein